MTCSPYAPRALLLLGLLAGASVQPGFAQEWIDQPVIAAAERLFATMPDDYFTVRPPVVHQEMSAGTPLVLDVREAAEFKAERILDARNIPVRQLARSIRTLPQNKDAPVIVYCRSGHRGAIALAVLRMAGYTNVRSLAGGLEGWKAAGLPVAR